MRVEFSQVVKQKLIFTQELRTAINILHYSAHELIDFLRQQANENPFVEIIERTYSDSGSSKYSERISFIERIPNSERWTLEDELKQQVCYLNKLSEKEKRIVHYLIGNLDERGYLEISIEEAADNLNVPAKDIELALNIIQSLEPVGAGARNLQECLILQLKRLGEKDRIVYQAIEHHLDDLAYHHYQKVAKALQVDLKRVKAIIDLIRSLDPKPGALFHHETPQYIVPDIRVERVGKEYAVLLNDHVLPKVAIHSLYKELPRQLLKKSDENKFFNEKYNEVKWLISSLKQRGQTIYRVSEAIMEIQRDFLDYGAEYIRPLQLKQIAQKLDMHESTVSRATTRKYIQTPRGIFELKYFFSTGLAFGGESVVSSESIKSKIKQLIQQEDNKKPLSDQALASMFDQQGIHISRRTVTKYREKLGIVSSSKRKKL